MGQIDLKRSVLFKLGIQPVFVEVPIELAPRVGHGKLPHPAQQGDDGIHGAIDALDLVV